MDANFLDAKVLVLCGDIVGNGISGACLVENVIVCVCVDYVVIVLAARGDETHSPSSDFNPINLHFWLYSVVREM